MTNKLILPLVSTGNVPQLAIDLILHNPDSNFKFVKDLQSSYLLYPFLGSLDKSKSLKHDQGRSKIYANTPDKLYTSALELFHDEASNIFIVQQRTPVITNFENNFFHELINQDLKEYDIDEIYILDSMGPSELEHIVNYNNINSQFFVENNRIAVGHVDISLEKLSEYFEKTNFLLCSASSNSESYINSEPIIDKTLLSFDEQCFQIGLNTNCQSFKLLYHILHNNSKTKIEYINMLVYEGDNSHDAGLLVEMLFSSKQLQTPLPKTLINVKNLVPPLSWNGVYGFNTISGSIDEGLYM